MPRRVLSEPLLHFAALGLVFFGLHAALAPARGEALVVDAARVRATANELGRRLGRAPAEAELASALQTELDEERLYREALALGLERDDPIVRRRLIQKLRFVHEDLADVAAPDDAALLAVRDADPGRYTTPARFALTQVFVARERHTDAEAVARALQRRLLAGEDPGGLGDLCVHGQRFGARTAAAYAGVFGERFAAGLLDMSPGTWSIAQSDLGWHVVRVDEMTPPALAPLAAVRPRLRADWEAARREASSEAALAGLRERYPVSFEGDVPPAVASALVERGP
ncbi:MAG TPA: peptidylprolyl isomerase [Nannocystis sp.]